MFLLSLFRLLFDTITLLFNIMGTPQSNLYSKNFEVVNSCSTITFPTLSKYFRLFALNELALPKLLGGLRFLIDIVNHSCQFICGPRIGYFKIVFNDNRRQSINNSHIWESNLEETLLCYLVDVPFMLNSCERICTVVLFH